MSNYSAYSDEQLVTKLQTGDEAAFQQLYYRYREDMARFAFSLTRNLDDAHDVLQEVFTYLWINRSTITIQTSIKAYLLTAVRNRSLRQIENNARQGKLQRELLERLEPLVQPTSTIEASEVKQQITKIISAMPERMREVILLSREAELSHRQIAEKLHITESTARKQVQKALRLIRGGLHPVSGSIGTFLLSLFS